MFLEIFLNHSEFSFIPSNNLYLVRHVKGWSEEISRFPKETDASLPDARELIFAIGRGWVLKRYGFHTRNHGLF